MERFKKVTVNLGSPEEALHVALESKVTHIDLAAGEITLLIHPEGPRPIDMRRAIELETDPD